MRKSGKNMMNIGGSLGLGANKHLPLITEVRETHMGMALIHLAKVAKGANPNKEIRIAITSKNMGIKANTKDMSIEQTQKVRKK